MNRNKCVEDPNMARRMVFVEDFEYVQEYLRFYRESKGFTEHFQNDLETVHRKARAHWQSIVNSVNANAIYYGDYYYTKMLEYLKILKRLLSNEEKKKIPTINEWLETYPDLMEAYQKLEQNTSEENFEDLFMDYYNELRIASNREYMELM